MKIKILFLDASDDVLIKRYKETRRKHPLDESVHGSLQKAIKAERQMLSYVKEISDYYIDTSLLSAIQLKERVNEMFLDKIDDFMQISVVSFGFKFGSHSEADLIFDVRCLPRITSYNVCYTKLLRGVKTISISVPCRYLHSPSCVIKHSDLIAVSDLAKRLLAKAYEI